MSFSGTRGELCVRVRNWATRVKFEQAGYQTDWRDDDKPNEVGTVDYSLTALTMDKYLDPGFDPNPGYCAKYCSEVWYYEYDKTEWIEPIFQDFGQNAISDLDGIQADLQNVVALLCAELDWYGNGGTNDVIESLKKNAGLPKSELLLENAISLLDHWSGDAAAIFSTGLGREGKKWTSIVACQFAIAAVLLNAVNAQLSVIVCARRDLLSIGESTIEALWSLDKGFTPDSKYAMTIVGSIVSVGLAAASLGTGSAMIGAIASIVTGAPEAAEDPTSVEDEMSSVKNKLMSSDDDDEDDEYLGTPDPSVGTTPDDVLVAMHTMIMDLKQRASDKEGRISEPLKEICQASLNNLDDFCLSFKKDIWESQDEESIYEDDILGHPVIETNSIKMHEGVVALAEAINPLSDANKILASCFTSSNEAFQSDYTPMRTSCVKTPWADLKDFLQDCLASNIEKLKATADVVYECAQDMEATDQINSSDMAEITKMLEGDNPEYSDQGYKPSDNQDTEVDDHNLPQEPTYNNGGV